MTSVTYKIKKLQNRTLRPDDLPPGLNLNELKILEAKLQKNGKYVSIKPQKVKVSKYGDKIRLNLVTANPPKKD